MHWFRRGSDRSATTEGAGGPLKTRKQLAANTNVEYAIAA